MLSAKTSAGTGEALYLDAETLPASSDYKFIIDIVSEIFLFNEDSIVI